MTPKLTDDLQKAIDEHAGQPIQVEHPVTHKLYVIVDSDVHEQAMQALRERDDRASIARGVEQMKGGKGRSLAQADSAMRKELGLPPPR